MARLDLKRVAGPRRRLSAILLSSFTARMKPWHKTRTADCLAPWSSVGKLFFWGGGGGGGGGGKKKKMSGKLLAVTQIGVNGITSSSINA